MIPTKAKPHGANRGVVSDAGTLPSASMANDSALRLTGNRCQCTACGAYFNGERAFDEHRLGEHGVNRHCMTVAQMIAEGFEKNTAGFWMTQSRAQVAARHAASAIPSRFEHRISASLPLQDRAPDSRPRREAAP